MRRTIIMGMLCLAAVFQAQASDTPPFTFENNKLRFIPDRLGNKIPDFSRMGYKNSDQPIPECKTVITIKPQNGDQSQMIQQALDKVGSMKIGSDGLRGAVELAPGEYHVGQTLKLNKSGVILRGAPDGKTILIATGTTQRNAIEIGDVGKPFPRLGFLKQISRRIEITDEYVPVGSTKINLADTSQFSAGDSIAFFIPPSQKWIEDIGMDSIPAAPERGKLFWDSRFLYQRYERTIMAIEGNTITIDIPVVNAINKKYGTAHVYKYEDNKRVDNCGVENLQIVSTFNDKVKDDEAHCRSAVVIDKARDCWVRKVIARHIIYACVAIEGSARNITVEDCANIEPVSKITGGRRYGFLVNGQFNLIQRCYTSKNRHAFITNSKVWGPNVFLDGLAEINYNDIGPHQMWTTATLYDNITAPGGKIFVQNRGSAGSGHGWAGANQVMWNCVAKYLVCEQPPGAQNYAIGCTGKKVKGFTKIQPHGLWYSHNKPVKPRSLYIQQLIERTGVDNASKITSAAQVSGNEIINFYGRVTDGEKNDKN